MTQGDPLSPTIFDVVLDSVVQHWVVVTVEGAEERGKYGKEDRNHNPLFYADNGMVESSDPQWLQGVFSTLVGLFDRVGLHTNFEKTVDMFCHPCQGERTLSEAVYRRRMKGEGTS